MKILNKVLSRLGVREKPSLSHPASYAIPFELFQKVNFLLRTVLYIDKKVVGLVIEVRHIYLDNALIIVDSSIDEFRYVIDSVKPEAKPVQYKVYETSEFKKNWIVDEIPTLYPHRYFQIQVNPNFS